MKKLLIALTTLLSLPVIASNTYDYKELIEQKCTSMNTSQTHVRLIIQREMYMGWDGYPKSNNLKALIKIDGKFDGKNKNINKVIKFESNSRSNSDRITQSIYSIDDSVGTSVSTSYLSDLAGDTTMPGKSTKLIIPNGIPGIHGSAILNLVEGQGVGFISLNIEDEHFKTISVQCDNIRDTADSDQEYLVNFEHF